MKPVVAPLALDYIAASLGDKGYEVDILDLVFSEDIKGDIARYFRGQEVEAVGITIRNIDDAYYASQQSFIPWIKEVVGYIKEVTDTPIILGGCGFSLIPEVIMDYCEVDWGIKGEGELSLPLFLEALNEGRDLTSVPNLVSREGEVFVRNKCEFLDLDKLSSSRRTTVDSGRYFREGGQGSIETKRGCEKRCIYCADPVSKGRKYRLRSPIKVVEEFRHLLEMGIDRFHLCDSEFNLPEEHARDVCEEIIRSGLGDRIRWYTYASPRPFSEKLASLMKKAGCVGIDFGVDSGSDKILRNLGRDFTISDIRRTTSICREYDIIFMFDLLLGGPGETEETLRDSIELMKALDPHRVGVSAGVRIYPGTPLAKMVQREGVSGDNKSLFGKVEGNDDLLWPIFYISPELGGEMESYLAELIGEDERFFFAAREETDRNYNYNDNRVLVEAIERGYRGAYWDILRRLQEKLPPD